MVQKGLEEWTSKYMAWDLWNVGWQILWQYSKELKEGLWKYYKEDGSLQRKDIFESDRCEVM